MTTVQRDSETAAWIADGHDQQRLHETSWQLQIGALGQFEHKWCASMLSRKEHIIATEPGGIAGAPADIRATPEHAILLAEHGRRCKMRGL